MKVNFFIGYDLRKILHIEFVNTLKRSSNNVNVMSLKLDELVAKKLYTRPIDPLASTQFTYTRFLVPLLNNYKDGQYFVTVILFF